MKNPTELKQWPALTAHQRDIAPSHMRDWFTQDPLRFSRFSLQAGELLLDYSRNRITDLTLSLLCQLAEEAQLAAKIAALFAGDAINFSENRPALHTALRDVRHTPVYINGENIALPIQHALDAMRDLTNQIHKHEWRGATGRPIEHIVNIGIGGSYLGPMMCTQALKDFAVSALQFHFISTIDQSHLQDVLQQIDPETTLFIISSKSFGTLETLTNARAILRFMQEKIGPRALSHHFIAVTAVPEKAQELGIPSEHIFPLWDFVGGRYSIWSAIGLPLMLMIGPDQFEEFLAGAHTMDTHFRTTDFAHNMPVILGLLSIWYINFFGVVAHAIAPYSYRLRHFVPYIQQAEMESNGKCVNSEGNRIHYATGPVIFGEEGSNGQHAYHQLLHQGQHLIPVDFILVGQQAAGDEQQAILMASGLSQAQALLQGSSQHGHQLAPGNRPSNIIFLNRLTPASLGSLLALYEHKIFVQSAIWNIIPFDQWGVELGKQLLPDILQCIQQSGEHPDPATAGLIKHYRQLRG
jgi:glucose-6-phosphate isomerase